MKNLRKINCEQYFVGFCCKDLDGGKVWDCEFKGDYKKCDKPDAKPEEK